MCDRRRFGLLFTGFALALLPGLGGCGKRGAAPAPVARAEAAQPLSPEECVKFVHAVEKAGRAGDLAALHRLLDWDALLEASAAGIDAPADMRESFAREVQEGLRKHQGFGSDVVHHASKGGGYKLLRLHAKGDEKRALFRLIAANGGGTNYHDYALVRGKDGAVRAGDVHVFLAGEPLSRALRRSFLARMQEGSGEHLARLQGWERDYAEHLPRIKRMAEEADAGRFQEALAIYRELPPTLQQDKTVLMVRARAAQAVSEEEYLAARDDFRKHHAEDACIDLLAVDFFLLRLRFAEALEMVDRVEKAVGGDPFLHVLRAGVHVEAGALPRAREAALRAVAGEPELEQGYLALVNVALKQKQYGDMPKLLDTLRDKFSARPDALRGVPEYAEFLRSAEGRQWANSRKTR